ncbi:MAG TPA: multiheme c-type cytochrome [Candidatus Binatia bacterium]|nr:multiheme c-type cytochrome [Candidatus Binatia bacterium]
MAAQAAPLPSTRQDFEAPGTQPLSVTDTFAVPTDCTPCHSDYGSPAVEPYRNWQGSMMAQSGRDPLMYAAMAIANQDAPHAGETCIRCHMPKGWLEGRSVPEDATATTADDRHGVQCSICHRLVDPEGNPGAPAQDAAILAALTEPVTTLGNAQMIVDPLQRLRGPFDIVADLGGNPHPKDTLVSPYHESSELCGTCHNVKNPIFTRNMGGEYELNTFDQQGDLSLAFPEQSTYDEWANSEYADGGVHAPQFAGAGAGVEGDYSVSTCQSCHMPRIVGKDASTGITRQNMPLHSMVGANTFVPRIIPLHPAFGGEVDPDILEEGAQAAEQMLRRAATVSATIAGGNLTVRVTNETGHKLPTGYPEGRRMWLQVRAFDADRNVLLSSGRYSFADATIAGYDAAPTDEDYDPHLQVWEALHGMSPDVALAAGLDPDADFHLILNNVREKDNRIPPRGFTNAAFEAVDAHPVGATFADGQYWDDVVYPVGPDAVAAEVTLYYQTTSREYVEFLRDENITNAAGPILFDLWDQNGQAPPVEMARLFLQTDEDVVNACRKNVDKLQAKYFKTYLGQWSACYAAEAGSLPCEETAIEDALEIAEARLHERLGGIKDKRCAGASLTPGSIGLGSYCPVPCSAIALFDLTDVASCAVCMAEAVADAALSSAYGVSPPEVPESVNFGAPLECQQNIADAATKLATSWTRTLQKCEAGNANGTNVPPLDCASDPSGKIGSAQGSAAARVGACESFTSIEGCADGAGSAAAYQCIEDALGAVVPAYAEVAYP